MVLSLHFPRVWREIRKLVWTRPVLSPARPHSLPPSDLQSVQKIELIQSNEFATLWWYETR